MALLNWVLERTEFITRYFMFVFFVLTCKLIVVFCLWHLLINLNMTHLCKFKEIELSQLLFSPLFNYWDLLMVELGINTLNCQILFL